MTCRAAKILRNPLEVEVAIYRQVWNLPEKYFRTCKRIFLKEVTCAEYWSSFKEQNSRDYVRHEDTLWEIFYTDEAYPAIFDLPDTASLLISFRHKILADNRELKIALVTTKQAVEQQHG